MSVHIMSAVWEGASAKGSDLLVLLSLADFSDHDGRCFPSVPKLMARSRLGKRAVQFAIRSLEESKQIEIIELGAGRTSTRYRICVENFRGAKYAPVQNMHRRGDPEITAEVNEGSPDPSLNRQVTKEDPPMSETATGNTAPEDASLLQKPDPLKSFPSLAAAYPHIIKEILKHHPKARFPASGTKGDHDARLVLSQLVRVDGFTEDEVLETFRWVLREEQPSPSGFSWRENFQSIAQLRNKKTGDTMHKFAKMLEAMQRHQKQAERVRIDPDEPIHHREAREKGLLR